MQSGKKCESVFKFKHTLKTRIQNRTELKEKTLYITDLDGTLLGDDSRVSNGSQAMLNEAIAAGASFSVATARTPATVSSLLAGVRTKLPMVVMTGATLWDASTGMYEHTNFIPARDVERIIGIYRRIRFSSFIYTLRDNHLHIYHVGPLSEQEHEFMEQRADSPFKTFHIPADGESTLPGNLDNVVLFYGVSPTERAFEAHEAVKLETDCSALCYHDIYGPETAVAEVFAKESTKSRGVKTLAERTGATRIVAFGDNINDIPMLKSADLAVAVANCVDEVRAVADIVIGPNTDDSVARFILDDINRQNKS